MQQQKISTRGVISYMIAALFLVYEMAIQVSPSIMTHQLMQELHFTTSQLGWIAGIYFYSYTLMQIPVGLFYDHINPRWLITMAAALCAAGMILYAEAHSFGYLALGRFLMGTGSAFAFVGVLVVADEWFPRKIFAALVGIAQLLAAFGAMGGEWPLAYLVNHKGWRAASFDLVIAGLVVGVLALIVIRRRSYCPELGKNSPPILQGLKRIFKEKQTYYIALYAFSSWAPIAMFAAMWGLPFLMAKYHLTNTTAAAFVAAIWLGLAFSSPIIGWISDKIHQRKNLMLFCAVTGLVSSAAIIWMPVLPSFVLVILLFLIGVAASGQILSFAMVRDRQTTSNLATAIGFNNMAVVAGGAIFQPLLGFLLHEKITGDTWHQLSSSQIVHFEWCLSLVVASFLLGVVVAVWGLKDVKA